MTWSVGSCCTGYGGLELALQSVLDTELAWVSEVDPSACAVLDARFPGVPNLGDLTALDWATVEPVDVLTAGYPCQGFSLAGKRKGADDERHLWPFIADALRVLRPRLFVAENVAGHLSLGFDTVLADLAAIGFDARWCVVRASDIGACHRRARLFVVAYPAGDGHRAEAGDQTLRPDASGPAGWVGGPSTGAATDADQSSREACSGRPGTGDVGRRQPVVSGGTLTPDPGGPRRREIAGGPHGDEAADGGRTEGPDHQPVGHGAPSGHDGRVGLEVAPDAADLRRQRDGRARGRRTGPTDDGGQDAPHPDQPGPQGAQPAPRRDVPNWGAYGPAIARHEAAIGRPAPHPVDARGRLSPAFVEFLMMLPEGWVTDVVTNRSKALKILGNGVVPPQCAYALRGLLRPLPVVSAPL